MTKHDDDFGTTLPRLAAVAPRPMTITQVRSAPAVAIVARPASVAPVPVPHPSMPLAMTPVQLAEKAFGMPITPSIPNPTPTPAYTAPLAPTPVRRPLNMTPRSTDPVLTAITSPAGREAAAAAASLVNTGPSISPDTIVSPLAKSPAALAAQVFGPAATPDTSGNGVGASGNFDDGSAGGAVDSGSLDSGGQSTDWSDPQSFDQGVSLGTPAKALALVPGGPMPLAVKAAAVAVPVKESFWSKLLALFGFGKKTTTPATVHGERAEPNSTRAMVESVVRRSRNGDQNAMALIALVRDNAKKGHPKAQETYALLQEYVRTNPVGSNPRIGLEPDYVKMTQAPGTRWAGESDVFPDAVALSHGPKLTDNRIRHMLAQFGADERKAIEHGIANPQSSHSHRGVRMGRIIGQARRLQAVRMPGSALAKFDPKVAGELDE